LDKGIKPMSKSFLNDADFKYINDQMLKSEAPNKTFTFPDGKGYSSDRLINIITMLNKSGYESRLVKLPGNGSLALHVEQKSENFSPDVKNVEWMVKESAQRMIILDTETGGINGELQIHSEELVTLKAEFLDSTAIKEIEWSNKILTVQFKSQSKRYEFGEVPEELFHSFKEAESKGTFYNFNVKNCFPQVEKKDAA
jgi:hypothetical protein